MKVSDFKLAEYLVRQICRSYNCQFVDIPLIFGGINPAGEIINNKLVLGPTDRLSKTIFQIVTCYISNIAKITGGTINISHEDQVHLANMALAISRDFSYGTNVHPEAFSELNSVKLTLTREPFVWLALRDIICPSLSIAVENINIVAGKSAYMDGAKLINREDVPNMNMSDADFPFIFVNLEVEKKSSRIPFVLVEAIRGHNLHAQEVVHDLLSKDEYRTKFIGLVKAAFVDDDEINDFLTVLSIITNYENIDNILLLNKESKTGAHTWLPTEAKTAQYSGNATYWYLGLTEKLLEPARGSDWSSYEILENFTKDLWERVEEEKKKRGLDPLPFELLLRMQAEDYQQRPDLTIQALLSDNRVW